MLPLALRAAGSWRAARWGVAAGAAVLTALAVGLPTAVIPNPLFARSVATPWWGHPVLALTAVLAGMLLATYVRTGTYADTSTGGDAADATDNGAWPTANAHADNNAWPTANARADNNADDAPGRRRASRLGTVGGVLSFFAVGCPVCNKLVLLALGTSGALSVWQPLQPVLALASLALLAVAVVRRLAGEVACPVAA